MRPWQAATAAILLALACGTGPPSSLTGTWTGATAEDNPTDVEIVLKDESGTLSGTIALSDNVSGTVSGTYADPDVTINIRVVIEGDTLQPSYKGKRVDDDRIEGGIDDPEDPVMLDLVRGG